MYSQRPVQPFVSKFTTTPVRTLRQNKENRPTLTMVNSPSTSMSPFRYSNTKKLKHDYSTGNYYQKQKINPDLLDDTINKLDFLEQKIARIMKKNDQLRQHLKSDNEFKIPLKVNQQNTSPDHSFAFSRESGRPYTKTPQSGKFAKSNSQSRINNQTINGRGRKVYENECVYDGEWRDGVREGNGTFINPIGCIIYQGQWKSDSFNGRGKFVNQDWLNESIDEASFKQFQQVQHHFKSYEGEFKNGQFWGMGTMIFEGGDQQYKYFGQFQCDTFHGIGSIEDNQNQEIIKGKWIYGTLV